MRIATFVNIMNRISINYNSSVRSPRVYFQNAENSRSVTCNFRFLDQVDGMFDGWLRVERDRIQVDAHKITTCAIRASLNQNVVQKPQLLAPGQPQREFSGPPARIGLEWFGCEQQA